MRGQCGCTGPVSLRRHQTLRFPFPPDQRSWGALVHLVPIQTYFQILAETSMKQLKKHYAIAQAALTGRLWRSGSALGGSGGDFRRYVLRTSSPELVKLHPENM